VGTTQSVPQLFTSEWDRFQKGVSQLDPESRHAWAQYTASRYGVPSATTQINIPGFGDIFHSPLNYQVSDAERSEFWASRREGRPPQLSEVAAATMQHNLAIMQGMRASAQPGYAKAFGTVLTALDNIQDFFSTLAALGSLSVYGATKGLNSLVPGLAADVAATFAQQAAAAAGRDAASSFAAKLVAEAGAGNLAARLALADAGVFAAGRAASIAAAEAAAYRTTFLRLTLGLGTRVGGRLLPVVGWVLLVTDLLNLLSFIGLMATPAYALACAGPAEALAAGMPVMVMKEILRAETWTMHNLNPFSRAARSTRAWRAARGLPGFSQVIEGAQTADNLFGWGLSLGGLVGAFVEAAYAPIRAARGESVSINTQVFETDAARLLAPKAATQTPAQQAIVHQAATIAATAPAVIGVQEVFDEDTHLKAIIAYQESIAILTWALDGIDWQDAVARASAGPIAPIIQPTRNGRLDAIGAGIDLEAGRAWWFPHDGPQATGLDYATYHLTAVPQAVRDFIRPRRNAPSAAVFGGYVNKAVDSLFYLFEPGEDTMKWQLTTDARLISSLTQEGFLIRANEPPGPLWAMWQDARQLIEAKNRGHLDLREWRELAERHGVLLIPMLPPEAPWPQAWHDYAATLPASPVPTPLPPLS
jgi:hypothetical protein